MKNDRRLLAAVLALLPAAAFAAGTFDASGARTAVANTRGLIWVHPLGAGTNRVVVVGVTVKDSDAAGSPADPVVLFGGIPMLAVPGGAATATEAGHLVRTQLFYLLDGQLPAPGTYVVLVVLPRRVEAAAAGSLSLFGLAPAPPEAVAAGASTGAVSRINTPVTTLTRGAWLVEAVGADSAEPLLPVGAGQGLRYAMQGGGVSAAGSAAAGGEPGPRTLSWRLQGLAHLAHVAAAFAPARLPLSVQVVGQGSVTPPGGSFADGAVVELVATPAPGHRFVGWSGDASGTASPLSVTMDAPKSITATFVPVYTVDTTAVGGGAIVRDPDAPSYDAGTSVRLSAVPALGFRFAGWSGSLGGTENPTTLLVDANESVTATFVAVYTLATPVSGQGTVSRDPDAAAYDAGTLVRLLASPAEGWRFTGWTGDVISSENPTTVTMDRSKSVSATFVEIPPPQVGIAFDGASSGATAAAGSVLAWTHVLGAGPNRAVVVGLAGEDASTADLTVASITFGGVPMVPVAGSKIFGGGSGRIQSELFQLLESSLPAAGTYEIAVSFQGTVDGVVGGAVSLTGVRQADPEAVAARTDTSGADAIATSLITLTPGAWVVDVVASGNSGNFTPTATGQVERFDASAPTASSGVAGAGSTRPVDLPGATTVSWAHVNANRLAHSAAAFAPAVPPPLRFPLSLGVSGNGAVTADPSPGPYAPGTTVTLTATPSEGNQFTGWSGDLTGSANPATVTMDGPRTITATFTPIVTGFTLTVNTVGAGSVTRNPDLPGYPAGSTVELQAVPAASWTFAGWSGDLTGSANPMTLTMDSSKSVTATFTPVGGAPDFSLVGWATANGGTTGGAGGPEVVVDNLADLRSFANQPGPYVIKVLGTITGNEIVRVRSDKSILGIGTDARLLGIGLQVGISSEFGQIHNVIIRNLTFEKALAPIDGVLVTNGAKNVWIDHCNFLSDRDHGVDFYDGLIDINHGADFITVSWSRFSQHFKTSLVGNSDNTGDEDAGHLTVTYHHNSFINSGGRNPSVRFGLVHVYNNLYRDLDDYAIASRMGAQVAVENNWFENVNRPIRADTSLSPVAGQVSGVDSNRYLSCAPNSITTPPSTWRPPYVYALDPVDGVPDLVTRWAGVGIVVFDGAPPPPTAPTITQQPASQTVGAGGDASFSVIASGSAPLAYQWSKEGSPIGGATGSTLDRHGVQDSDAGSYTVLVSNAAGSVLSDAAVLTVTAVPPPPPPTVTLLHDVFTDGERNTQALPDSAAWFTSSGGSNLVAAAGSLRQIVSSSRTFLGHFTSDAGTPASLTSGQTLTLDFDFRFSGFDSAAPASDATFRVGLLRSVANPAAVSGTGFVANGPPNTNARVTGDFGSNNPTSNVFSVYSGYGALTSANGLGTAVPARLFARTTSGPSLLGSTAAFTEVPAASALPSAPMEPGVGYRGVLSVRHTGTSMALSYTVSRASDGAVIMTQSVEHPGTAMTEFDTVAFYLSKNSASPSYDLTLTRVEVNRTGP